MRRISCGAWIIICLSAMTGCGETKQDVIVRHAPQCQQMRVKLRSLLDELRRLNTMGQPVILGEFTPPRPSYDGPARTGNTEIIMAEQLESPEATPPFDLMLSQNLTRCLAWTGANSPLSESARAAAAGNIEEDFQRALGWEYLIVVRVVDLVPPRVVGEGMFEGGNVTLDVFIFQGQDPTLRGAFSVAATAADSVSVTYKQGESKNDRAVDYVRSSLWQAARKNLAARLNEFTGGSFRFDETN